MTGSADAGAPVELEDWIKASKAFEPTMTAQVGAPAQTALDALAAALAAQGYKVKDATPAGFQASYRALVSGILGLVAGTDADILDRTLIAVAAAPSGDGTLLTISVEAGGQHRAGRTRGRTGLTGGLQDLQRRGVPVTVTPWQKD
jgi:hypothetical protein